MNPFALFCFNDNINDNINDNTNDKIISKKLESSKLIVSPLVTTPTKTISSLPKYINNVAHSFVYNSNSDDKVIINKGNLSKEKSLIIINKLKEHKINTGFTTSIDEFQIFWKELKLNQNDSNFPFAVLCSGVISSQVRDKVAINAIKLLINQLPDGIISPENIISLSIDRLENILKTLNYYKSKAKSLLLLSNQVVCQLNYRKTKMIPNNYKELTLLHGVGPKIANLCLSVGFSNTKGEKLPLSSSFFSKNIVNVTVNNNNSNKKDGDNNEMNLNNKRKLIEINDVENVDKIENNFSENENGIVVDTHVNRVAFRIGLSCNNKSLIKPPNPEETRRQLELLYDRQDWKDVTVLLIGLGQSTCINTPKCSSCPLYLSKLCNYGSSYKKPSASNKKSPSKSYLNNKEKSSGSTLLIESKIIYDDNQVVNDVNNESIESFFETSNNIELDDDNDDNNDKIINVVEFPKHRVYSID